MIEPEIRTMLRRHITKYLKQGKKAEYTSIDGVHIMAVLSNHPIHNTLNTGYTYSAGDMHLLLVAVPSGSASFSRAEAMYGVGPAFRTATSPKLHLTAIQSIVSDIRAMSQNKHLLQGLDDVTNQVHAITGQDLHDAVHAFMNRVVIFTLGNCPFCFAAKNSLTAAHIPFVELSFERYRGELITTTRQRTAPSVFLNGMHLGGFNDEHGKRGLKSMIDDGTLIRIMKAPSNVSPR